MLSVGISDYPGDTNDLSYTAQDAVQISAALRDAGVLAPRSEVITEQAATVAAVRAAFARIAAEAGPDDVFLFFFSGHGTQTDVRVSNLEPDGRMENIVMRDGDITDVELGQMFETVRAGTSIVALDSCFSGGFARNVVNRPGVMGLFSSEEDLTSLVASNFRAGGYLSHFLRAGFGGAADGDRNGTITAGELSTYLHQQFNRHVQNVAATTTDGQSNFQRLVIDRGAVQIDAPLLTLASTRMARSDEDVGSKPQDGADVAQVADAGESDFAGADANALDFAQEAMTADDVEPEETPGAELYAEEPSGGK